MQVFVDDTAGARLSVDCTAECTVLDLRLRAAAAGAEGAVTGRLRLSGEALSDADPLSDAGVTAESVVQVVPRPSDVALWRVTEGLDPIAVTPKDAATGCRALGRITRPQLLLHCPGWGDSPFHLSGELCSTDKAAELRRIVSASPLTLAVRPGHLKPADEEQATSRYVPRRDVHIRQEEVLAEGLGGAARAADLLREVRLQRHLLDNSKAYEMGPSGFRNMYVSPDSSARGGMLLYAVQQRHDTDLGAILRSRQSIQVQHIQYWAYLILRALHWMHINGMAHGHLSIDNIDITSNEDLYLLDAGRRDGSPYGGTPGWADVSVPAPEQVAFPTRPAMPAGDIYSVGLLLAQLHLRADPLHQLRGCSAPEALCQMAIKSGADPERCAQVSTASSAEAYEQLLPLAAEGEQRGTECCWLGVSRVPYSGSEAGLLPDVHKLMRDATRFAAADRPSAAACMESPWLADLHDTSDMPQANAPYTEQPVPEAEGAVLDELWSLAHSFG
eukprot:TRINITY_DN12575_c0_g1_i1.p1 TRINITY_DN12575_c0_g1~~TRINITY_DN12575_c0_g1_i1.p1  ORF type:complete len:528 (+),score=106.91 TRINITY_DN12575_c0_g1_i1:81-1586(+)